MHELEARLSTMRAAWSAGRPAAEHAPLEWREVAEAGPNAEAALAAFAAQALQTLFQAEPPKDLVVRAVLPRLAAPLVPESERARVRRLLTASRNAPEGTRGLVRFLAARGCATHPADWLPGARDDWAPAIYAPWQAWAENQVTATPEATPTAETWDDWPSNERRIALLDLRRRDPAAASALIVAKAAGEPVERRLKLLEILETGLAPGDAEGLAAYDQDRSDRVRALIHRLLARLDVGNGEPELTAELAATVELGRVGLLNRQTRLTIKPLKTAAQTARRHELYRVVPLAALAATLGTTEAALVETLPQGQPADLRAFVNYAAQTAADPTCRALLDRVLDDRHVDPTLALPLAERLPDPLRAAALPKLLARGAALDDAIRSAGPALGGVRLQDVMAGAAWSTILDSVRTAAASNDAAQRLADAQLADALPRLGLLLDAPSARAAIDRIVAEGLSAADPRLDALHLNAALASETTP